MTPNELSERLLDFAVMIGRCVDHLPDTRLARHVAAQLIRSGTSPAPNYEEGCAAESNQDFIDKISICLKELRESRMWLQMIIKAKLLPPAEVAPVLNECTELCNILGQSRVTAKGIANRS